MRVEYKTKDVCATKITYDLEDGKIHNLSFLGGCNGNLKAIGKLLEGMDKDKAISILLGNTCGRRPTSCCDQLARSLQEN